MPPTANAIPLRRQALAELVRNLILGCSALAILPGSGFAQALQGDALLREVDRNLAPDSYEMYRKLIDIQPDGTRKEFLLYSVKKGTEKVLLLFLQPASEKGRSTLRLGDNMWFYIPEVGKPVRITSLQSVTGGLFNNSDILRLDFAAEYSVTKTEDAGAKWLLHLKAKTDSVAYDLLKMWVHKERLVPTEVECYAASGLLIKTLHYKDIKDLGDGVLRPATVETDSPLHKGYRSLMIWARIKPRPLRDEVFTLNFMPRVEELRR